MSSCTYTLARNPLSGIRQPKRNEQQKIKKNKSNKLKKKKEKDKVVNKSLCEHFSSHTEREGESGTDT